jgi:hypothetical protein
MFQKGTHVTHLAEFRHLIARDRGEEAEIRSTAKGKYWSFPMCWPSKMIHSRRDVKVMVSRFGWFGISSSIKQNVN